jgi:hypothetical protein
MLVDLQIAVINQDKDAVQALINEIDRRTENEMFRRAGEHFGFKTVEAYGRRIANRAEMICRADRIADKNLRQRTLEHIDDVLDGALKIPKQSEIFQAEA